MKKSFTAMGFFLALFMVIVPFKDRVYANVFAAQIQITNPDSSTFDGDFSDGTGALIRFFLNDTADAVTIDIIDSQSGLSVHEIIAGAFSRGEHYVAWDGTGAEAGMQYQVGITAEQNNASTTDWTMFYDSGDINIFARGVAVVTDQQDPNFGLIFTANDGGPLGTGINIFNPDGSSHDPFLVAPDPFSGGTVDYGTDAPLYTSLDSLGRLYVTLKDLGQIMRINRDFSTQVLITGLTLPKGLYVEGAGEDFTIYVAANNQILRANIGTAETFEAGSMDVLAEFSGFLPHQVILDDEGALYTTLRTDNDLGSDGAGMRKFDISGALPVTDNDASWFLTQEVTFIANDMLIDHGSDRSSSADDILYFCTRAGDGNDQDGIWRVDDINSVFPNVIRIITEDSLYGGDENIQARATMDFDAAGNIILMENANEHVFFVSPPGEGEINSFTTTGADTYMVNVASAISRLGENSPASFYLSDNYPNPFNPSTNISFTVPNNEFVTLVVYNALGQHVKTLVRDNMGPGSFQFKFDGSGLPSGAYFYRLTAGDFQAVKKMILTK